MTHSTQSVKLIVLQLTSHNGRVGVGGMRATLLIICGAAALVAADCTPGHQLMAAFIGGFLVTYGLVGMFQRPARP